VPGLPKDISVPIPSLVINNIGNADGSQNGAAVKDVVMQVVTALSAKASESGKLPLDFNSILQADWPASQHNLAGNLTSSFRE